MADRNDLASMKYRLSLYEFELENAESEGNESEVRRLTRIINGLRNEIYGIIRELESEGITDY